MQTKATVHRLTRAEREIEELATIRAMYRLPPADQRELDRRLARAEQRRQRCRAEIQSAAARNHRTIADIIAAARGQEGA